MIVYATSLSGFSEMETEIASASHPVWLAAGVLSEGSIADLRGSGLDVSVFEGSVPIDEALQIIREHHPGEEIYVAE